MSPSRLVVLFAALTACDPPREPEADAKTPTATPPAAAPVAKTAKPSAAEPVATAAALQIRVDAIRIAGDTVEIELALDRRIPPTGGSRPTLHIGDVAIQRSRRPDGALDRIVFLVERAVFDTLVDGATLVVRDRVYSSAQMTDPPRLDKSAVTR